METLEAKLIECDNKIKENQMESLKLQILLAEYIENIKNWTL